MFIYFFIELDLWIDLHLYIFNIYRIIKMFRYPFTHGFSKRSPYSAAGTFARRYKSPNISRIKRHKDKTVMQKELLLFFSSNVIISPAHRESSDRARVIPCKKCYSSISLSVCVSVYHKPSKRVSRDAPDIKCRCGGTVPTRSSNTTNYLCCVNTDRHAPRVIYT